MRQHNDKSGAAPATVSEHKWINTPLRMAREGDSQGTNPLASPETGLKPHACIARGDAGSGLLFPVIVILLLH